MDDALWQSVGDKRSERCRAATAAGDPKHGVLECLAFRPGVYVFADGQCHEVAIQPRDSDRRRNSQSGHGRSTTLALLDDGRTTGSPRHGVGRQLMRYTFEQSDRAGLPCYLETFSESSVRVHESQLYSIRKAIEIPDTPLTLYAMVRPPQ
jgi:hypothetical protein